MEEVAALLKQARESKGVSLKQVETATRIPIRYLEVLEGAGNPRFLADRLYLIPFLRNYAAFLDINPETAVARFIIELQRIEASATRSKRPREPFRLSSWVALLSLLVASLVILSFVWRSGEINFWWPWTKEEPSSLSSGLSSSQETSQEPPASSPSTPSLSSDPSTELRTGLPSSPEASAESSALPPSAPSPSSHLPSSPEAPAESSTPSPSTSSFSAEAGVQETTLLALSPQPSAIAQKTPHLLRVQAKERAWVRAIIDDGEQVKDVLLRPGEKVEWLAREELILTLGNAGGVDLTFNGKDLPPLGASGQVIRNLRLPPPEGEERG